MSTVTLNLELNPEQTEALLAALISQKAIANVSTAPSAATTAPITPAPQKAPVPANPIVAGSPFATIPTMAPVTTPVPIANTSIPAMQSTATAHTAIGCAPLPASAVTNPSNPSMPMTYHSNSVPSVPTSAPAYSQADLAGAAAALMDAGKIKELQNLIAQFGVPSLTMLPKERYGEFATALRGLGAKL